METESVDTIKRKKGLISALFRGPSVPIHAKLMVAFVLVIVLIGTIFLIVGVQLTSNRVFTHRSTGQSQERPKCRQGYL